MIKKVFAMLVILTMCGCASNSTKNPFELGEGSGALLKNTELDGMLMVAAFQHLNCTELKHGHQMVQSASYRVPSGPAFVSIHVRWAQTVFGPIYYANADFELPLKESESYSTSGSRSEKLLSINLVDGSGNVMTDTQEVELIMGEGALAMPHIPKYVSERCEKSI